MAPTPWNDGPGLDPLIVKLECCARVCPGKLPGTVVRARPGGGTQPRAAVDWADALGATMSTPIRAADVAPHSPAYQRCIVCYFLLQYPRRAIQRWSRHDLGDYPRLGRSGRWRRRSA